ncbi:MAG: hypothetical protein ABW092_18970, partial [Candidatus Thiodiazotropha sp.]
NMDQHVGQSVLSPAASEQSAESADSSEQMIEQLLNGTPNNTNVLPISQCHTYGSSLSALVPDKIKSQIWDNKYVEMAQLYQIQVRGEIKQDFAVNITNQGPSTVVKVQPKQMQGSDLSINTWLTAFHCYMDVYLQKFPNQASGMLAYTSLIRDLERSCGTQAFNFYDRSFRSHRQSQNLPWGQMHSELWNKAVLMSLSSSTAIRSSTRPGSDASSASNKRVCFKYNSPKGCSRRQCYFNHVCSFCSKKNHTRINCFAFKNQQDRASVPQDSVPASSTAIQGHISSPINRLGQGQTAPINAPAVVPAISPRTQPFRKSN